MWLPTWLCPLKVFRGKNIFIFGTPLEFLWNPYRFLLIGSLAYNTWLIFPYFPNKYLLSLKLVLAAGFALDIEFVLSSHQSTGRNRHTMNKSNQMNNALGGLCSRAEVSACLQEIQYKMNGFGKRVHGSARAPNEQAKGNMSHNHTSVAHTARICMVFKTQLLKPFFTLKPKAPDSTMNLTY